MSGAEAAIAGIGFLCNAMQIVTFGRDILQVYSHVRNEHSPDPRLKAYLESAKACFDDMNSSALATSQALQSSRDQQQIIQIGKKLEESMTQLQSKFSELHIDEASKRGFRGKIEVGKKTWASLWQGKELESLEVNLKRYESLLHGVVLQRVCNQSQAAELSSKDSFNKLDTNLQSIIIQLADGCTRISDLSIESLKTRNLVTQEHESTRAVINEGFTTTQGAISSFRDSMSQEFQDMARRDQSTSFEKEHNELLQSIRFPEMNSRKNHISENYPGTFDWVFENVDDDEDRDDTLDSPMPADTTRPADLNCFPTWLESGNQQFWVSGKPASGKSSLMKFLATNPLTLQHLQAQHRNIKVLTHYFWKPGQPLQKNIEGMARSLLHQILHKNRDLAHQLWSEHSNVQDKRDRGDWDMNELKEALCWVIKFSGNTFCIFLDGLDEAKEFEDLPWGDNQNTQVIYDLLSLDNIKLCASSREEDPFSRFFAGQPRLRTHQLNKNDIYHFAKNRLETSGLSSDDRSLLLAIVVEKAKGVFLWVVLVIKSLNQAIRSGGAKEFEERLAQTPSDLHDLLVDMWSRPGDDAKLSTYRLDAARFFSLALTATKIDACGYNGSSEILPFDWMRSILVMTTALEDKPFLSILRESGEIQAQELLARCARVEDRLRLVCRGLLEVTTPQVVDRPCAGNEALCNYSLKRVEFIHRCAFDFITDTQFGRQCLALCHWPSIDKVKRLLVGHLVKSRFLRYKSKRDNKEITGERKISGSSCEAFQPKALNVSLNWSDYDIYFRNSMLKEFRDWQQRGLFYNPFHWNYSIFAKYPSNRRELNFIENVVRTVNSGALVSDPLDQLSDVSLLEAIPALLCALVGSNGSLTIGSCLNFVDYVLTRLGSETDERWHDVSSQGQRDVRNETRLLHSWFVMQCLNRIPNDWSNDRHKIIDLLRRFSHTLSSPSDWQRPLVLEYGVSDDLGVLPKSGEGYNFGFRQYTLAIGNFVTAYRLLGQRLPDLVDCALHIRPPQDAKERFEIVVNRCNEDSLDSDRDSFHLQEVIIGISPIA
ncbi:small s [Fusarium beomiforme]|uniref:Small s n=1 Tax=Fusarium beomiforme TaxID=44412 RepID=A0A9P5A7Y1_9HYPO|nr:small s [Fusarium beomiforme]